MFNYRNVTIIRSNEPRDLSYISVIFTYKNEFYLIGILDISLIIGFYGKHEIL